MKKKMKCLALLAGVLAAGVFAACASQGTPQSAPAPKAAAAAKSPSSGTLVTNGGEAIALSSLKYRTTDETAPAVYYISDISPEALQKAYDALQWSPTGKIGVKISTGESDKTNHLRPALIAPLVQSLEGTIVECNTAYGGNRANTAMHYQLAKDHGYTDIAPVQILDEAGSMTLPVAGGIRLTENYVGRAFADYDSYLVLSHFKGHTMGGFGGALKNISIGFGSSEGKKHIHSGGTDAANFWGTEQDVFLESMAEAAKSVADAMGERIIYISVMNRLSVDCDCDATPDEPDMHDIGILASRDPVALDEACVDLVYAASDSAKLRERIETRHGIHTIEHAAEMGVGRREYRLIDLSL